LRITWTLKYKPKTLSEVVGNDESKKKILEWVHSWDNKIPKKRALFLYGPPGTGKTVSIEVLANDLDMELVQSNASDCRTANAIERFAGRSSEYDTLYGNKRLILFDELDGITGSADRGGLRAITGIVKKTGFPIILVASNAYDPRFSTLRKYCQLIEFKKTSRTQVQKHLRNICSQEGIETEDDTLKLIAKTTGGDVRSAVNDLQALAQGKKRLTYDDVSWLASRDRKEVIFNSLRTVFYAKNLTDARRAVKSADVDSEMFLEWIYENLPYHVGTPKELAATMDMLAQADIYRGRIRSTQNWRLMRYFIDFMTAGVASSWSKKARGWVPFRFPSRIRSMSNSRAERAMMSAIGTKIGKRCHISSSRAVKDVVPYLRVIFQNNIEMKNGLARWLDLDEDMTEYVSGKHN
jgi:replication factor C large subunit